jgi:hypothetical protein
MTSFQVLQLAMQAVTTTAVLVGIALTLRQLKLLHLSYRDLHDSNRRRAAHDAVVEWATFAEDGVKLDASFSFREPHDVVLLEETTRVFAGDPAAKASLHRVLNYLECVANGVNHGVLDEDVIRSAYVTVLRKYLIRFAPYIEERRSKYPELWVDVRDLASQWDAADQRRPKRSPLGGGAR